MQISFKSLKAIFSGPNKGHFDKLVELKRDLQEKLSHADEYEHRKPVVRILNQPPPLRGTTTPTKLAREEYRAPEIYILNLVIPVNGKDIKFSV